MVIVYVLDDTHKTKRLEKNILHLRFSGKKKNKYVKILNNKKMSNEKIN